MSNQNENRLESAEQTELQRRKRLTFAQAEGAENLPQQLKRKELSRPLRIELYGVFYDWLDSHTQFNVYGDNTVIGFCKELLCQIDRKFFGNPPNIFNAGIPHWRGKLSEVFTKGNYIVVYGLVQFFLRHLEADSSLRIKIANALKDNQAGYYVIENTLMPLTSVQDAEAVKKNLALVRAGGVVGATQHLQNAMEKLNASDFPKGAESSIEALESIVRSTFGTKNLKEGLQKLDIHPALKKAILSLYGYASDEDGMRHSLTKSTEADVGETDALLVFSVCAALVGYITNKTSSPNQKGDIQ